MLAEIFSYTKSIPLPSDVDSACCTLRYLESCNLMFENGLLSHERVESSDSKVIQNIHLGFKFFCDWLDSVIESGKNQCDVMF